MSFELPTLFPFEKLSKQTAITQILKTNEHSSRYGLTLTEKDALQLIETRNIALKELGRIEVGSATIGKLIDAFCDSTFINQDDYTDTLDDLLEIFYYIKNESMEEIPDDELIELMRDYFENRCGGSLELLRDRELEKVARNIRYNVKDYTDLSEYEKEDLYEEDELFDDI